MPIVTATKLSGVLRVVPEVFEDHRGSYVETYNEQAYREAGIAQHFVQDDISTSRKDVLRGIHGDAETWKLISCPHGAFYFVVVDNDPDSPQYRQWEAWTLSAANRVQILVPPHHGNGHLVLTDTAIFHYKQTTYYNPAGQFTIRYDDPDYGIWWPVSRPILSRRDAEGAFVA